MERLTQLIANTDASVIADTFQKLCKRFHLPIVEVTNSILHATRRTPHPILTLTKDLVAYIAFFLENKEAVNFCLLRKDFFCNNFEKTKQLLQRRPYLSFDLECYGNCETIQSRLKDAAFLNKVNLLVCSTTRCQHARTNTELAVLIPHLKSICVNLEDHNLSCFKNVERLTITTVNTDNSVEFPPTLKTLNWDFVDSAVADGVNEKFDKDFIPISLLYLSLRDLSIAYIVFINLINAWKPEWNDCALVRNLETLRLWKVLPKRAGSADIDNIDLSHFTELRSVDIAFDVHCENWKFGRKLERLSLTNAMDVDCARASLESVHQLKKISIRTAEGRYGEWLRLARELHDQGHREIKLKESSRPLVRHPMQVTLEEDPWNTVSLQSAMLMTEYEPV